MRTKHTKGNWDFDNRPLTKVHGLDCSEVSISSTGDKLGEWIAYVRGNSLAEREANARLIAAAPELLEALMSIENDNGSIPDAIWQMRNKAIQKAIGGVQ